MVRIGAYNRSHLNLNIFEHDIFFYTIYINNLNGRVRPTPDLPPQAHRTSESSSLWSPSRLSTAGSAVGATLNE